MDIDKTEGSYLAKTNHGTREKYAIKASKLGQKTDGLTSASDTAYIYSIRTSGE